MIAISKTTRNRRAVTSSSIHRTSCRGTAPPDSIAGFFDLLTEGEEEDYILRNDLFTVAVRRAGVEEVFFYPILDMLRPIATPERLGVTFTASHSVSDGSGGFRDSVVVYGNTPGVSADDLRAKAVYLTPGDYPRSDDFYDPAAFFFPARHLERRNIYAIGGRDIDATTFELTVSGPSGLTYLPGDPEATYLRMLGVDKEDERGNPGLDGKIDHRYVDFEDGLIKLPDLRPFAPAAIDSVWPFHFVDLGIDSAPEPDQRPAFFVGNRANRAPYDKLVIDRRVDSEYQLNLAFRLPSPPLDLTMPAYPNPFRDLVQVPIDQATLYFTVYAALGRRLLSRTFTARGGGGRAFLTWNGRDQDGGLVPAGIYFMRIRAQAGWETRRKVMFVR